MDMMTSLRSNPACPEMNIINQNNIISFVRSAVQLIEKVNSN